MKRKIRVAVCLALCAGLFISCGNGKTESGSNQTDNGSATENRFPQNQADGSGKPSWSDTDVKNVAGVGEFKDDADMPDVFDVLLSSVISGRPGAYVFSFEHPAVPEGLHLTVSLRIYREGPSGDIAVESWDSDGAWLGWAPDYDPSERSVSVPLEIKESLMDKYVMISVRCFGNGHSTAAAMAVRDYDGSVTEGLDDLFAWEE